MLLTNNLYFPLFLGTRGCYMSPHPRREYCHIFLWAMKFAYKSQPSLFHFAVILAAYLDRGLLQVKAIQNAAPQNESQLSWRATHTWHVTA